MGVLNVSVKFDNVPRNRFPIVEPGRHVSGIVVITTDKPKRIRNINLLLQGKAEISFWTSEIRWFKDKNLGFRSDGEVGFGSIFDIDWNSIKVRRRLSEASRFKAKQILLDINIQLTGETYLGEGDNQFPFHIYLPDNLPSTFKNKYGEIRYKCKVHWTQYGFSLSSDSYKIVLQVVNHKTMHFLHQKDTSLFMPRVYRMTRPFKSLFSTTNPFTLLLKMPQSAVVSGDTISIGIEVDNSTKTYISSIHVRLIQKSAWIGKGWSQKNVKVKDTVLQEIRFEGVAAQTNKSWLQPITILAQPNLYIEPCFIMKQCYLIVVEVVPSGYNNVSIMAPIEVCSRSPDTALSSSTSTSNNLEFYSSDPPPYPGPPPYYDLDTALKK